MTPPIVGLQPTSRVEPGPIRRWLAASAFALVACSGAPPAAAPPPANPVRLLLQEQIAARPADAPLQLRYNPASCDCPAFELLLAGRWIRADWRNQAAPEFASTARAIAATPADTWPVPLRFKGSIDGDIVRTAQGQYALRFRVTEIMQAPALAPAPTPAPAAPAASPAPTPAAADPAAPPS